MSVCNLLDFSESGGCGCKIPPQMLTNILKTTQKKNTVKNEDILLGFETSDDCAIYNFGGKKLLFSTDFFSSTVSSPYLFGKIAAANALSDIYATGGRPLIVNSILAFPPDDIPMPYIEKMIEGAQEVMAECGATVVGGHTIKNAQPLYGFAVIGEAEDAHIRQNNTPRNHDLVIITKPLGIGIISNALKAGRLLEEELPESTLEIMSRVNRIGYSLAQYHGVSAMTDITGFGLAGHLSELVENTGFNVNIDGDAVPVIEGVEALSLAVTKNPSGTYNNISRYARFMKYEADISDELRLILHDPQTNGGLLFTVDEESYREHILPLFEAEQSEHYVIGTISEGQGQIIVK
ncbi:selenide, water dikinase SelD [Photobacterium sp. CCB-ST2H9]|uniref:selenide, water dikinase SelD n=1 Tax=unclassified Photobacterium TaxID=2628852 RepID=UPI00200308C0|nr:selenide, water dikinase SelD [Photobacterium sp. CCB-ST2H9]UTM58152.1 selenide, water dikinase SelD [Photobacterium sp. CCB-ST2H9]